ncbi:uncharacterized protein LOC128889177 [Hylaeus anthracinus]|uniref:uncharacterized protein LOC128889177 n=1 Tax=Hylaeus anthracinus TaxID=313031 RepID=UPI0023B8961B|nr:uncharacterized protein LOC128889177 [Hylaeus anthracinus]
MKCEVGVASFGYGSRGLGRLATIGWVLLVILCFPPRTVAMFDNSSSTFVERCRMDCSLQKDLVACGKYRVVRWLQDTVRDKEFGYGPFRIVRIPSMPSQTILPKVPQSRVFKSGAVEALNFLRDNIEDLLTKRAVVYTADNSPGGRSFGTMPMIVDEDELKQMQSRKSSQGDGKILFKKKKSVIVPILILLNLVKLKLLLLPIFLGVHFIKKLLVLASLILPSILAHLKICKVPPPHQQSYPYHTWATAAEAPVDYPTGYGQEEAWAHRNDYVGHVAYPGYPSYHGLRNPYG